MTEFKLKFREEYVCLKCKRIFDKSIWGDLSFCPAVEANGKICGGAVCVRIHRVY